jgi:hypothetical protein
MVPLERLLARPGSRLAELARYGLAGLRAGLELALRENPGDPAADETRQLLDEVTRLLGGGPAAVPTTAPPLAIPVAEAAPAAEPLLTPQPEPRARPPAGAAPLLTPLRQAFESAEVLRGHLGPVRFRGATDAQIWAEVQGLLLRLPGSLALTWRQQAARLAQEVGAVLDHSPANADLLPWSRDEEVYPGLAGSVQARGLRLERTASLPPSLEKVALTESTRPLAAAVALVLYFIEQDANLHHALKAVQAFGVNSLTDPEQRDRYVAELLHRFQRVVERDAGPAAQALWARIEVDEALASLVYLPPVNRETSWWGKLQQEVRRSLDRAVERARQTGTRVHLQTLWGPYARICDRSSADLEIDSGSPPGEVVASLRVYAQVDQDALPGRVLHRSARNR